MAVIYLKHPDHGAKVAIAEAEAVNDEENGWERFDPNGEEAPPKNKGGRPRKVREDDDL